MTRQQSNTHRRRSSLYSSRAILASPIQSAPFLASAEYNNTKYYIAMDLLIFPLFRSAVIDR